MVLLNIPMLLQYDDVLQKFHIIYILITILFGTNNMSPSHIPVKIIINRATFIVR